MSYWFYLLLGTAPNDPFMKEIFVLKRDNLRLKLSNYRLKFIIFRLKFKIFRIKLSQFLIVSALNFQQFLICGDEFFFYE